MKTTAPLTKSQYGIYAECIAHQGEVCYQITYLYTLDGGMDEQKLKAAIESAVAAHPTLFTRIGLNEQGDPQQILDDSESFSLEVEHVTDIEAEKQGMTAPFDLYKDRLFRMRLLKDSQHLYLLINVHHIIADGTSLKVILDDIDAAYGGKALEPEVITLADVARQEAEKRQTAAFEEDKQWYAKNFDCSDTFSQLIPDLEEPTKKIGTLTRKLNVGIDTIEAFREKQGIFKNTLFTGVYGFLMAKYNNEQEALFSSVHKGRQNKQLKRTVGMLVKTFPVFVKFSDDTTTLDFLKATQEQITGCRTHDSYSFTDVISDLNLQMGSIFSWHGTILDTVEIAGKAAPADDLCYMSEEMPLYVRVTQQEGRYFLRAEYNTGAYSEQLVSQFLESYETVLDAFLKGSNLRDITIVTQSQVELLDSFNQTDVPYDTTQTIVSLFRQQVKATPENIAVVYKDKQFTYQEVDELSDRIAGYVSEKVKVTSEVKSQ